MSYSKITRGLITAAIILISSNGVADSEKSKQLIPPIERQTKAPDESQDSSDNPQKPANINTPLINISVGGNMNIHPGNTENGGNTESNKWADPIVLFTFLLVIVGGLQWWVLRRQATILKSTAEVAAVSERAYLNTDNFGVSTLNTGTGLTVYYQIWNSGKIPAQTIKTISKYHIGINIPTEPIYDMAITAPPVVVRPDSFVTQPIVLKDDISQDQVDKLKRRELCIFVWGKIIYTDSFGREKVTGFGNMLVCQANGVFFPEIHGGAAYNYFT